MRERFFFIFVSSVAQLQKSRWIYSTLGSRVFYSFSMIIRLSSLKCQKLRPTVVNVPFLLIVSSTRLPDKREIYTINTGLQRVTVSTLTATFFVINFY